MRDVSIKKNLILSTAYQILTMITPLITAPYVSRVLGADGVGIYSYTYSIETYFSMFAALGTVTYGAREIARNRDDKRTYSKLFWEIEILTILTTAVCLIAWGVWISINSQYRVYYVILTFYLLGTMFDISWFYTGLEQFKYTVTQNTIFKLIGIVALFVLVKDKSDVTWYTAIMSLSMLFGNISMWMYLPRFLVKVSFKNIEIKKHFRETLVYFIPTIATSIYTVLDKTLIGVITNDTNENGYYEQATKIINMAKAVTFTSLNSVLGSRISYLYTNNNIEEIKTRISQSIDYILFMGIGICFGLIGVSGNFVPLFFGEGYSPVVFLLRLLSPVVIIIGISNCLGSQYYTPAGYRAKSARYLIYGSVSNLLLNIILIPNFKSTGAVVATLFAESLITVLYIANSEKMISIIKIFKLSLKKILAAILMLIVIMCINRLMLNLFAKLVIQILVGGGVYVILLYIFRDSFVCTACGMIINSIRRGRKFETNTRR